MGPRLHPRRLHAPSVASDHPRRALGSTLFFPTCTPPRLPTAAPVTTLTTAGSSSTSRCTRRSCDPRRRWPSSYPPPTCSAATTATASPRRTALRFGPRALNQRAVTRFPRPLLRHHLHPRDRHALRPARSHVRHLLRRLLLPVYQFTIHAPRITTFDHTLDSMVIYTRGLLTHRYSAADTSDRATLPFTRVTRLRLHRLTVRQRCSITPPRLCTPDVPLLVAPQMP